MAEKKNKDLTPYGGNVNKKHLTMTKTIPDDVDVKYACSYISQDIYKMLANILEDIKREMKDAPTTWNKPVEELRGVTMTLIGQEHLQLNFHKYFVGNQHQIQQEADEEKKFMNEVEKELKKRFKKVTKRNLNLKKIKEDRDLQPMSKLTPDSSWMLGSSRHGYGNNMIGRWHIRNFRIYTFENFLDEDE